MDLCSGSFESFRILLAFYGWIMKKVCGTSFVICFRSHKAALPLLVPHVGALCLRCSCYSRVPLVSYSYLFSYNFSSYPSFLNSFHTTDYHVSIVLGSAANVFLLGAHSRQRGLGSIGGGRVTFAFPGYPGTSPMELFFRYY